MTRRIRRGRVPKQLGLRLAVVKGVLIDALTVEEGARKLKVPRTELIRLVAGARRAVIDALGAQALEAARSGHGGSQAMRGPRRRRDAQHVEHDAGHDQQQVT